MPFKLSSWRCASWGIFGLSGAKAIAEEMINLYLHLDNVEAKAELWKTFAQKYGQKPEKR
jgi:hypothetical protein